MERVVFSSSLCLLLLALVFHVSWSSPVADTYYECLLKPPNSVSNLSASFFPRNSSQFTPLFVSTARNLRYLVPSAPKPELIFTPLTELQVQAAVRCAALHNIHTRVRSGGHDYEAISYVSQVVSPFILIDMSKLRAVDVNIADNSAWAQTGATNGEVYYRIAEKSSAHGFPAGLYSSLGMGGHISGGAYGALMRKYGLGADNVVDARIVSFDGKIHDRASMGEDVFWAIRGGGGSSFGIVLAWKLRLVPVPPTVTLFKAPRTLEQGLTKLLCRWSQVANKLDNDLFMRVLIMPVNSTNGGGRTVSGIFDAVFQGNADRLLRVLGRSFPELNVTRGDLTETNWLGSVVLSAGNPNGTAPEVLLTPKAAFLNNFKAKSDMVREPLPESVIQKLLGWLTEEDSPIMIWNPFGGKMDEIPETSIPFPHRKGVIFMAQYVTNWQVAGGGDDPAATARHLGWIRKVYSHLGPYVSAKPRGAYANYRDLDLGMNNKNGSASVAEATRWAAKYFGEENFRRLVRAKTAFDPRNFFRNEQSIPTRAAT